jgi:hypothetical protein
MFQFPSLAYAPYVFRYASPRITTGGFPHSEIPGSLTGQRLPRAYRSRPRPSSPLGAKASTVCPCSLDQKNSGNRCRYGVFKVHASLSLSNGAPAPRRKARAFTRSLKTQQQGVRRGRHDSRRVECRTEPKFHRTGSTPTDMKCRLP